MKYRKEGRKSWLHFKRHCRISSSPWKDQICVAKDRLDSNSSTLYFNAAWWFCTRVQSYLAKIPSSVSFGITEGTDSCPYWRRSGAMKRRLSLVPVWLYGTLPSIPQSEHCMMYAFCPLFPTVSSPWYSISLYQYESPSMTDSWVFNVFTWCVNVRVYNLQNVN